MAQEDVLTIDRNSYTGPISGKTLIPIGAEREDGKLWAGSRYLYQSPESYQKLKEQGEFKFGNIFGHQAREAVLSLIPQGVKDKTKEVLSDIATTVAESDLALKDLRTVYSPGSNSAIAKNQQKVAEAISKITTPLSKASAALSDATNTAPWISDTAAEAMITGGGSLAIKGAAKLASKTVDTAQTLKGLTRIVGGMEVGTALNTGDSLLINPKKFGPKQKGLLATLEHGLEGISTEAKEKFRIFTRFAEGGAKPRHTANILQLPPDSPLFAELANVTNVRDLERVATNYFNRNPLHVGAGVNLNLDHMVPVGSVGDLLAGQKLANIDEALKMQYEMYGRLFGDAGELSSMPRFTHALKHSGSPVSINWDSPWAKEITRSLPKNASAKEISDALSKLYDKSIIMTGQALQAEDYINFRAMVMDSLPSDVRRTLGPNFDMTGRTTPPEHWALFKSAMNQLNTTQKQLIKLEGLGNLDVNIKK